MLTRPCVVENFGPATFTSRSLGTATLALLLTLGAHASPILTPAQKELFIQSLQGKPWVAELNGSDYSGYDSSQSDKAKIAQAIGKVETLSADDPRKELLKEIVAEYVAHDLRLLDNVNEKSLIDGINFLIALPKSVIPPSYSVHDDGEFSLIWRNERAILSLAFSDVSAIRFAYYAPEDKVKTKGQVPFEQFKFLGPKNGPGSETLNSFIRVFSRS